MGCPRKKMIYSEFCVCCSNLWIRKACISSLGGGGKNIFVQQSDDDGDEMKSILIRRLARRINALKCNKSFVFSNNMHAFTL